MRKFMTQEEIQKEKQASLSFSQPVFDMVKLLIIYARQSTKKQYLNNKESAKFQTHALLLYATEVLGWPADKVIVYVENKYTKDGRLSESIRSVSARFGIDVRPGLRIVTERIEADEVAVVLVVAVDRLFRDETGIKEREFAQLCKKHNTLVLTHSMDENVPDVLYDLSRTQDRTNFLHEAEMAAEYNEKQIKGKMLGGRRKKTMRGEYGGYPVATGFLLDKERKSYEVNSYWNDQLVKLFQRCIELDFNLTKLRNEVIIQPWFPDLPEDKYEELLDRMGGKIMLTKVPGGYTVSSHAGLKGMLTNVEYLGHAYAHNRIVARNVYPQLVPEELFWPCFNHISEYDIEGNRIKSKQASKRYQKNDNPKTPALLAGTRANRAPVITSTNGKSVYVQPYLTKNGEIIPPCYMIVDRSEVRSSPRTTYIQVQEIDTLFEKKLLERLNEAKALSEQKPSDTWAQSKVRSLERLNEAKALSEQKPSDERLQREVRLLERLYQAISEHEPSEEEVQRVHAFLDAPEEEELSEEAKQLFPNPEQFEKSARQFFHVLEHEEAPYRQLNEQFQAMEEKATSDTSSINEEIRNAKRDLAQIEREFQVARYTMSDKDIQDYYAKRKKLQGVIEEYESRKKNAAEIQKQAAKFLGKVNTVREKWGEMDLQHRQWFIRTATQTIVLDELAPGWITLTIVWLPIEGLAMIDEAIVWPKTAGKAWAPKEEAVIRAMYPDQPKSRIVEALPFRSWLSIKSHAMHMGVARKWMPGDTEQPDGWSRVDMRIFEEYSLSLQEEKQRVWWHSVTNTIGDSSSLHQYHNGCS